jgi:hypothetical protein
MVEREDDARAWEAQAASIARGAQAAAELGDPLIVAEWSTLLGFADVFALVAEGMRRGAARAAARSDSPSRRPGARRPDPAGAALRRARRAAHDRACDALLATSDGDNGKTDNN